MSNQPVGAPQSGFHITPKVVLIAVIAVASIIFVFLNRDSTTFDFLLFDLTMPTWIAFLGLLVVGAVIGYFGRGARDKRRPNP